MNDVNPRGSERSFLFITNSIFNFFNKENLSENDSGIIIANQVFKIFKWKKISTQN
jgi:hypothetical protein